MLKIIHRSDDQLRLFENGKEEILAKRASKHYYLSSDGDYVFYLANSKHWHNGDLYVKKEGKSPVLLGTKANLIHVSPAAERVLYIDKYFEKNQGSLYLIENGEKKTCLDRNVSATVIVLEKSGGQFKIYYEKRHKNLTSSAFMIDEHGTKHSLGKFYNIRHYRTNDDQLRIIGDTRKNGNEIKKQMYHDEHRIDKCGELNQNDSLDSITFSAENIGMQLDFYNQIRYPERVSEDTDDIVFQFSNHTSNRYYVACEIVKRAKAHYVVKSPYTNDDSINHFAVFSKEQKEDILLLHYTLTTGVDFLATFKLFGVSVEDLIKHAGPIYGKLGLDFAKIVDSSFMIMDTSEKLMYGNIQKALMETHHFQYKQELKAYLLKTYLVPLQSNNANAANYYSNFITSKQDELALLDKMKLIEEDLILKKVIPSKWKSEHEMFTIIKDRFLTARLHASPSWLAPQHLDVYIEDLNLAFEYQGEQHFNSIEYFGGEEALQKRIKLDKRKKELCEVNGVRLIEWMFTEPVTKLELERKLKVIDLA